MSIVTSILRQMMESLEIKEAQERDPGLYVFLWILRNF